MGFIIYMGLIEWEPKNNCVCGYDDVVKNRPLSCINKDGKQCIPCLQHMS